MLDNTTKAKIDALVRDTLYLAEGEIDPSATIRADLGADDIDKIEIVIGIEGMFDIDLSDDEIEGIQTVNDLYRTVEVARAASSDIAEAC